MRLKSYAVDNKILKTVKSNSMNKQKENGPGKNEKSLSVFLQ